MRHFPIFLDIKEYPCLVVGGGQIATRKIQRLLAAGACVTVIAPDINTDIAQLAKSDQIKYLAQPYSKDSMAGMKLVIAATNDKALNQLIADHAHTRDILFNVVDDSDIGNFIMPAIVNRAPVVIAIATGGKSPILTRLLRKRLEVLIPPSYGELANLIARFRDKVTQRFTDDKQRCRFWEHVLAGPMAEMLCSSQAKATLSVLEKQLSDISPMWEDRPNGEVYLVGAGPGDPDLLTLRALRFMQQADVVLYDRLVASAIVEMVNQDAERIYIGKERDQHTLPQQEINQMLVDLAKAGKRVLRLKGGDPFIFGRGGEEISLLSDNNIMFHIVPGITAASGCAAYAGIPLTHRDYAQSCLFVTGHLKNGTINLNWQALIQPQQTLAIYMGTHGIDILSKQLIKHGLASTMPAAIVQQGTTAKQRVYATTVSQLAAMCKQYDVKPPSMIIIGDVVVLQEKLAWFKQRHDENPIEE